MPRNPEKVREYIRRYYEKNRDLYRVKNNKMKARLRELMRRLKSVPCSDCGVEYPYYVMDFDHREGKQIEVSLLVHKGSKSKLLAEIAKCDVVCSNCHRLRTFARIEERKQAVGKLESDCRVVQLAERVILVHDASRFESWPGSEQIRLF